MKLCSSMLVAATLLGVAGGVPSEPAGQDAEISHGPRVLELLRELDREPRIVGTPGYGRTLRVIEETLKGLGITTARETRDSGRAIPLRSDVLLFEDGTQAVPFGGLREKWSPDAVPTMERPMAYDHNHESADVRGPVVSVGGGAAGDYDRLKALGVDVKGCVCMVQVPLVPGDRALGIRELATEAKGRGATGLLVAPKRKEAQGAFPGSDTDWVQENTLGSEPLALPVAPLRAIERDELLERLRAKRMRGADGKAETMRLGPGPVEAGITIRCPLVMFDDVEVLTWQFTSPRMAEDAVPAQIAHVSVLDLPGRPFGGALGVAQQFLAITRGDHRKAFDLGWSEVDVADLSGPPKPVSVVFGPFAVSERGSLLSPTAMGSRDPWEGLPDRAEVPPGMFVATDRVEGRVWGEIFRRIDAGARLAGLQIAAASLQEVRSPGSSPLPALTQALSECAAELSRNLPFAAAPEEPTR